jgi:hypothetical protein
MPAYRTLRAVTHDFAAALFVVPAALFTFVLMASRVWLAYLGRTAGPRLRRVIALQPAEAADLRSGVRTEIFFSALAIILLVALVVSNLGRPDGTFALVLGAGGLLFAAVWIAAMAKMTITGRQPDGRGQ